MTRAGVEREKIDAAFDNLVQTIKTKETDQGIALYSRANESQNTSAPDKQSVHSIANSLVEGVARSPAIVTVQSVADLPFAAPENARGVFWHGKIYLVADNLGSHDANRETVAHELMGHFGLRGFFGDKLDVALNNIYLRNAQVRKLASAWKSANTDLIKDWKAEHNISDKQVQFRAIEEAMSEIAQTGKTITGLVFTICIALKRTLMIFRCRHTQARQDACSERPLLGHSGR